MKVERYLDLPPAIYQKVEELSEEAFEDFKKQDYKSCFEKYEQCLAIIPEPKKDYGDASCVIEWMVTSYLEINDFANAKKWVEELGNYLKNKDIMGDWEFLKGKVYFEAGEFDMAWENFNIANTKTSGDCFKEQEKKYRSFFSETQKAMKKGK